MGDGWDGVKTALGRFGLPARLADRSAITTSLAEQICLEEDEEGDQFLMRLLCAQLFSLGAVEDSLVVWWAKSCCFDTMLGIDVQFLCGAGLEQTIAFLRANGECEAQDALNYLAKCGDDFVGFTPMQVLNQSRAFYRLALAVTGEAR